MIFYTAHPIRWIDTMKVAQYKRASLPCHCGHCGGEAGSRIYKEAYIPVEAGNWLFVSTRTSRLCASCFPIVVAELRKENANVCHDLPKLKVLYTEILKRDGGGNDYREHWSE